MRHRQVAAAGTVHRLRIESRVLIGNPLGDPAAREVHVYTPAGYREDRPLPLIVWLAGFTQSGLSETGFRAFGENMPERLDRLIDSHVMNPVVMVFPDCFTRLGGNQYINSAGIGRYADHLTDEILPFVEMRFAGGGAGRRGCMGRSYGGYGALLQAMTRPGLWSAIACHSGYMGFELAYLPDLAVAAGEVARHRSVEAFLAHVSALERPNDREIVALAVIAMAATYDPDPDEPAKIRLPIGSETAEPIAERWERWLAHDPIRLAAQHADALRSLKLLYFDCGNADPYHLHFGSRRLERVLDALGVPALYEEFDGGHETIDFRLDRSLPLVERALRGGV